MIGLKQVGGGPKIRVFVPEDVDVVPRLSFTNSETRDVTSSPDLEFMSRSKAKHCGKQLHTSSYFASMSSHVPFLAVRPNDQFSTEVTPRKAAQTNAVIPSSPMDSPPPLTPAPPTRTASKIPEVIRFPLVVIVSLSLSTLLHTLTAEISGFQLATASRALTEPWQIATLLGWKVVELFVAWTAGYDCMRK